MRRLYWWALSVRALVGLLAYALTFYADLPLVEDASYYEEAGYEVALAWLSGRTVDFSTLGKGAEAAWLQIAVIAAFYFVFTGIRALPALIIAYSALTACVPIYVYRFAKEMRVPEAVARRAGWLVVLSPAFVFWSGSLYKEGLTLLFLSVATYHTLRLQSGWRGRSMIILGLCMAGLWGVRYYLAVVLAIAVALSLLWGRVGRAGQSRGAPVFVRQAAVVLVFLVVVMSVGVTVRTDHVLLETDAGLLMELDERRAGSAIEAGSGYLQEESIATPGEALRYFPVGLFYFLTVPFPWQLSSLRQNLIIPENTFWLALYPLILLGIKRALKVDRPGTVFLLLMSGGMCVIYALLAANVGTAYRMRSQVWLLWAPFAAWGWELWRERWRKAEQGGLARRASRVAGARSR